MSKMIARNISGDECQGGDIGLHGPNGATMGSAGGFSPGRLWSLWDMLTKFARPFIRLGEEIQEIRNIYIVADSADEANPALKLNKDDKEEIKKSLEKLLKHCEQMSLPISITLLKRGLKDIPQSYREFDLLMDAVYAEIRDKLFVFIPQHRRKYFRSQNFLSETVKKHFHSAHAELRQGGKCFAIGLYTAAVFHAMRAVEVGMRWLADELNVTFPFPKELADWANLIDKIEAEIRKLKDNPKSTEKDEDLKFYSDAGMQFRYFKDGWRIRVAHTRETYDEGQALTALDHSVNFFETLAKRRQEADVSAARSS
jgi:hypothetical protein